MKGRGRDPGKLRPVVAFSLLLLEDSGEREKSLLSPRSRAAPSSIRSGGGKNLEPRGRAFLLPRLARSG